MFTGTWMIEEMEMWDKGFIDMDVPGYLRFNKDNTGDFQFGLVRGFMDFQVEGAKGKERIEFTWEGSDEMDPASGRGWASIENGELIGRIFFHFGDNSSFRAVKKQQEPGDE